MMGRSVLEARGVFTLATGLGFALALSACADERDDPMATSAEDGGIPLESGGSAGDDDDQDDDDDDDKLDVGGGSGGMTPCAEGGDCDECVEYEHTPCDNGTTDLFNAMGLNCPGEASVTGSTSGSAAAIGIRSGFGNTAEWAPREGSVYAVIGSGIINELDTETPPLDPDIGPTYCNDDLGDFDPGNTLPAPIRTTDVLGDCAADPTFLGTGDCSNTIQGQFNQGMSANDYTEIRILATVPPTNNSISYDFAFFSTEYPFYFGSAFNDMYVGWLESESWTGNISFDNQGNPISLNAGFLDFRDDSGATPELAGTCMRQHAGTKWLSSTAPVTPAEEITLVLAVFDLSDSILDSYVFLDNFGWGCEGTSTPETVPVG